MIEEKNDYILTLKKLLVTSLEPLPLIRLKKKKQVNKTLPKSKEEDSTTKPSKRLTFSTIAIKN